MPFDSVTVTTHVNGAVCTLQGVTADDCAAELLRDRLGLTGTKVSCGHGVCGACTVLVDGAPMVSCLMPGTALAGREVRTIEDFDGHHPIQLAFMAEDALQCGFCTPGFVVESIAFHDEWRRRHGVRTPSSSEIDVALAGHLCRCGTYPEIRAAVTRACVGDFDNATVTPPRHDAPEKVTGRARYTVDVRYPGMLEARFLRSPHAHARVTLGFARARTAPGVRAVLSLLPDDRKVRFAGQEIAAVAATNLASAEAALHLIEVAYEPLPALIDAAAATAPDAPPIYETRSDRTSAASASEGAPPPARWHNNVRGPFCWFSTRAKRARDQLEETRKGDGFTVAGTWQTQVQCHSALEPHACVAAWSEGGALTVHISTQAVSSVAADVAERWQLAPERVRLIAEYVGGGFGAKAELGVETIAAVELARMCAAPVRVALDRREELTVGGNRPATRIELALSASSGLALNAMQARAHSQSGVAVGSSLSGLFRTMYRGIPKDLQDWDVVTTTPPGKPFRGPGGPPALFALEQAIDELAVAGGEDPIAFRNRSDSNPARRRVYGRAAASALWLRREPSRPAGRYRRGIGFAAAGWFAFNDTSASVALTVSRDSVIAATASQDIGTGTRSTVANAVGAALDIPPADIIVHVGDSRLVTGPTSAGSRTTSSLGPAAEDAVQQVRNELVCFARRELLLADVTTDQHGVTHAGGRLSWRDLLHSAGPISVIGRRRRDVHGYFLPFKVNHLDISRYLTGGGQVTEVEVDTRLRKIRVLAVWAGFSVGRIYSPTLAMSQARAGIVQSLSYALFEERRLDPTTGQLLTGNLEDYIIAGIGDIPPIEVEFLNGGFEDVRGGGVGLGELVTLAGAASLANAVHHATGFRSRTLPLRFEAMEATP